MNFSSFKKLLFFAAIFLSGKNASAQLSVANVFSSNMVLQRDKPIFIWGKAKPESTITVSFINQHVEAKADTSGYWKVVLKPVKASATPHTLQIKADTIIQLNNILVGDIWLCSGQSNMEYPMDKKFKKYAAPKKSLDPAIEELCSPNKSTTIRYLYVERTLNKQPLLPTKGWINADDTTLKFVSAIGYFFAKEINAETGVPIGIISSSWGGTKIEEWTPDWAYMQSPIFKDSALVKNFRINGLHPGQKFNGMIKPMLSLAIKGVLWYQGENNCNTNDHALYPEKFKLFVDTWRNLFADKKMPFYYVQIAPCLYTQRLKDNPMAKNEFTLPLMWEAQTKSLSIDHTGMAVTTDLVDNLNDIHPPYKWMVGHRLALWAKAKTYNIKKVEYSGPQFHSMKIEGQNAILTFSHASGLKSNDDKPLNWFSVAGEDGKFFNATAEVANGKIIISSPNVQMPMHVRFAWNEAAQPNLVNAAGLPAIPFRTNI